MAVGATSYLSFMMLDGFECKILVFGLFLDFFWLDYWVRFCLFLSSSISWCLMWQWIRLVSSSF